MTRPDAVVQALRSVLDPELGIDVVNLGLVYGIAIGDEDVRVRLGVTAPTCPLSDYLLRVAEDAIGRIPGVGRVTVDVVLDPPWTPEMMSDEARRMLGWS